MQTDIPELLKKIDTFKIAVDQARGKSVELAKAAPLEISFYNIATKTMHDLKVLEAHLEDANGTYLKEKK